MAFRTRTLTGQLVDANGMGLGFATIRFRLNTPIAYSSSHIVFDTSFTVGTNDLGVFSAVIWADEDSLTPTDYLVTFPIEGGAAPSATHQLRISVPYEDGSEADFSQFVVGVA